jgi:hypothetical protein
MENKVLAMKGAKFGDKRYSIRAVKIAESTIHVSWTTSWKFKNQTLSTESYELIPDLPGWKEKIRDLNAELATWVKRDYSEDMESV